MSVNNFTKNLMQKFPSWMKLAKDENSIGAQFLDVFGITFDEFQKEIDSTVENFYINTANIDMIDIIYKVPLANIKIDDFSEYAETYINLNDDSQIMVHTSHNLREFYKHDESSMFRSYVNRANGYLYLRVDLDLFNDINQPFKSVVINGAPQYELIIHHVWNAFDEFGLLLNIYRLEGERNESFKNRILDVFKNPGNSTPKGMINGISRDLGIDKEKVNIYSLSEKNTHKELITSEGKPTKKMISYAKQVNDSLKFTWDALNFGEAYWHSIEEDNLGIDFLPHIWDTDMSIWEDSDFHSGIGDGDDLFVHKPKTIDSNRKFRAYISLIGYYEEVEEIYPEIKFRYKIYAKGKIPNNEYKEELFKFTTKSSRLVNQNYNLEAEQLFKYNFRTDFFNKNKFVQDDKMVFIKSNDFLHTVTDNIMRLKLKMSTRTETDSPSFSEITVVYEDTTGADNKYTLKTRDDFLNDKNATNGKPMKSVNYADVFATENSLELGFGAFQKIIDTTADFQSGNYETNSILIKEGKLSLNLDLTGKIQN